MSKKTLCLHVRPSPDDLARIARLEEEIAGRVEEMVRILARVHERPHGLPVVAFTRQEEPAAGGSSETVAWHEFTTEDGHTGCWDNVHDTCCAGPCPC